MNRLINRKTLLGIIPLSERTIDAMEKRGEFPRRFALSVRNVVWDFEEVQTWIAAQKQAARQAPQPGGAKPTARGHLVALASQAAT